LTVGLRASESLLDIDRIELKGKEDERWKEKRMEGLKRDLIHSQKILIVK